MIITKKIAVVDFGGQYAHLIASRVRRLGAYTEILSNEAEVNKFQEFSGIIFSGGPSSVYADDSPKLNPEILHLKIPILGICYGHQLTMKLLGGEVISSQIREYGDTKITVKDFSSIFSELNEIEKVWMSHGDEVAVLPEGFTRIAGSENCKFAAVENKELKIFGIQFHPEVTHTENGNKLLLNFIKICGAESSWSMENFLSVKIEEIKNKIPNNKKVFMLVSGGVDSTVAYTLLAKALGSNRVMGLLVDTGFMRKKEVNILTKSLHFLGFDLKIEDASEEFYSALKGHGDAEEKRKIIGKLFIEIQDRIVKQIISDPENWILGQGTIYPDTIESGGTKHSSVIKTHHNRVQAVIDLMNQGKLIEPISELYKDEVRELGALLGLPSEMISRHPFPGPGLAVRMLTGKEDRTFSEINSLNEVVSKWKKAKVTVLPIKSVGVQGDSRTYCHCALLNNFTRKWDKYSAISTDITNSVKGINRVIYIPFENKLPQKLVFSQIYPDKFHADILRSADFKVNKILKSNGITNDIWQMPVALIPVGKKKGLFSIVLRPVESNEAMTANFYPMKRKILKEIVKSLKELEEISYIFYDITNKPPGTIEWE